MADPNMNKTRTPEQSKSQTGGQPSQGSQTGEPGRGRSELEQNREFDKSRSEPTSR